MMHDMRRIMTLCDLTEGRVYQIASNNPRPYMVISNPSQAQSRTLAEVIHRKERGGIYIRGLLNNKTVYVWDGWQLTHDDVLSELLPHVDNNSSSLSTFEIANYRSTGLIDDPATREYHAAQCKVLQQGDYDPLASSFVLNVMAAIDLLASQGDE